MSEDNAVTESHELPEWVIVPEGLKVPSGRTLYALRFRAEWTDTPHAGERQCLIWPMSVGDHRLAMQRAAGDANRVSSEVCKQMIRAVDGVVVDRSGAIGPGNVDVWWEAIGTKCRTAVERFTLKLSHLSQEEAADFFENCVAARPTA